ncbi:hypothetical protein DUNSADRAFT_5271 [Dunaliella salina]|uniref:Encoded protein n=1 Tax=Dunaliella salina TaxID=3046 RepID=A0ABQ7GQJ4_DUNSA|nr:hypothetical protein DUNSADRAFT_5271 [Dunaliella salina]|eukprot:KAF5836879.1 hypothetical protein DUNSADRAFT_5271 [Dunaliella salina]
MQALNSPSVGQRVAAHAPPKLGPASLRQHRVAHRAAPIAYASGSGEVILDIKGLRAKIVTTGQEILTGVDLTIREV